MWPERTPVSGSRGSNHSSGSCVLPERSFISFAGSLLGSDRDTDRHAVDPRVALPVSVQHFAGKAIGGAVGAVTASSFRGSVWAFGVAVLLIGLLFAVCGLREVLTDTRPLRW